MAGTPVMNFVVMSAGRRGDDRGGDGSTPVMSTRVLR
jgi:hypothetical protein